jgi:hypothetical protein
MKIQTQDKLYRSSKMRRLKKGLAIISLLVFISSCSKVSDNNGSTGFGTSPVDCSVTPKTFLADVLPLVQASCGGCHGTGSNNGPGALTSYTEIFNARAAIRTAVESGRMPQNGSLTGAQKAALFCWMDNGAPNN